MKLFSVVFLLCLTGCVASSASPELDRSLQKEVEDLLAKSEVLVSTSQHSVGVPGFSGYQCFEPMFYVITLGIIPAHCRYDYILEVTISQSGVERTVEFPYRITTMQGWLMALYPLLPEWVFGSFKSAEERAKFTVLNSELRTSEVRKD